MTDLEIELLKLLQKAYAMLANITYYQDESNKFRYINKDLVGRIEDILLKNPTNDN